MAQQMIWVPVVYSEREAMPHFHLHLPADTLVSSALLEDQLDEELRRILNSKDSKIKLTEKVF